VRIENFRQQLVHGFPFQSSNATAGKRSRVRVPAAFHAADQVKLFGIDMLAGRIDHRLIFDMHHQRGSFQPPSNQRLAFGVDSQASQCFATSTREAFSARRW
jgi:hypothetical protein